MGSEKVVETALGVLKAWTCGDPPASNEVELLRQHALPDERDLPADELACRIVFRECGRAIQDSQAERKRPLSIVRRRKIA